MSLADRTQLSWVVEGVYGTFPAASTAKELRFTSESLQGEKNTVDSSEIRDDRQVTEVVRTATSVSGDVNVELSYTDYETWMLYALQALSWAAEVDTITATATLTFATNTITTSSTWDTTPTAGSWIKVSGATDDTSNNGYFKVSSVVADAPSSTVITVLQTLSAQVESGSVTIKELSQCTNGTTQKSIAMVRNYSDLSTTFEEFDGCVIDSMSWNFAPESIVTGSFSFVGSDAVSTTSSTATTITDAGTEPIFNCVDDVLKMEENNSTLSITNFSFSVNNNLRMRREIGTLGPTSVGAGQAMVEGTLQAYFTTADQFNRFLNHTQTSLSLVAEDSDGNAYIFSFPAVQFTSGARVAGGVSTDIIADFAWRAERDTLSDEMIQIAKFEA